MTVYLLPPDQVLFPPPDEAEPDGLLAVGGDLSLERLLTAYGHGIFPWYSHGSPILWWSPDPRCVVEPARLHVPKSLRRVVNARRFDIRLDTAFTDVIDACAGARRPQGKGTWITPEMRRAYCELHQAGYAHSVEAWELSERGEALVGGLYGVCLGRVFFGESMYFARPDASKAAFVWLAGLLAMWDFPLIDCQQTTEHLLRFGAFEMPREVFRDVLARACTFPTRTGAWAFPEGFDPLRV